MKDTGKDKKARELLYGKYSEESMYRAVYDTHERIVRYCDYCGNPLTASEANDFGSLCER